MRYMKLYENFKGDEVDNLIQILKRDCGKFIEELKFPLFRGFGGDKSPNTENSLIHSKNVMRTDRRPLDTNLDTHYLLNVKFEEIFNTPVRNGTFVTPIPSLALQYGSAWNPSMDKVFMFFPIGDYKYYWSPIIEDMFTYIDNKIWFDRSSIDIESEWESGRTQYYNGKNTGIHDGYYLDIFDYHRYNNNYLYDYKFDSYQQFNNSLVEWVNIKDKYGSFDEYESDRLDQIDKMEYMDLDYITNTYRNNNINKNKKSEVSFFCEEYYLVEFKLKDVVKDPYTIFNRLKN